MATSAKPVAIKLLKKHTHAGRDWEPGATFPIDAPNEPFSIDVEAAAWLVGIQVAEYA